MSASFDSSDNRPFDNSAHARQRLFVLISGILALTLTMGIARFAYTPMLVLMQQQADLSASFAAVLASINYLGYLLGALIAASISDMRLKDSLYRLGLGLAIVTTVMMGLADNIWLWAASRFLAGLSSAAGLLLGSGLVMNWLIRHHFASQLGLHFAGVGIGIAVCSALVEVLAGLLDWQQLWFSLSALGFVLAIPAWLWLPRVSNAGQTVSGQALADNPPSTLFLRVFMLAYFCAGVGYVVSATFIVAIVEQLYAGIGNQTFIVLGLAAAPACIIWDKVAHASSDLTALLAAYALQIISIAIPLFDASLLGLLGSAFLFGFSFIGLVSLVLSMAGRYYPSRPAKMMGKMTLSYGVAQILAPAFIALAGDYQTGLWLALVAMLIGAVAIVALMRLEKQAV